MNVVLEPSTPATERHYTVQEVAEMWSVSEEKVRRMFQDVPGVLKIGFPGILPGRKRPHVTLRIPASVLERFHQERSAGFRLEIQPRRRRV